MKFVRSKHVRTESGGDTGPIRPLPSPEQLPTSAQEALASLLLAAQRPFVPSVAQLATEHLTLFVQLREMKARWGQISDFLYKQGLTGPNGKISGAVWRATVSRALRNRTSEPTGAPPDAKTSGETTRTESERDETVQRTALQTAAERSATKPNAPEWGVTERAGRKREASDESATTPKKAKRDLPQQSETPRNEGRGHAPHRNVLGPPAAAVRTPLRAYSESDRIADLIDKPFRTR